MPDRLSRMVEDREIATSGSLVCPAFDACDKRPGEKYATYVRRHCRDHWLGEFSQLESAERNLGLWCFYYDHKYVFGNATLTPQPFYEIHQFVSVDEWGEEDLEERVPIQRRTFARIPDAVNRRPGDARKMKQLEVPRQCEKTSIGANAYSIFRSKHEYYVRGVRNFPIMIRSETAQNARDSLARIKAKAKGGSNIMRLYGVRLIKCSKCGEHAHVSMQSEAKCPGCGETRKIKIQPIALIDPTRGAGGTGRDSVTFRWSTNTAEVGQVVKAADITLAALTGEDIGEAPTDDEDFDPTEEDEAAVYSVRSVGLKTRLTGQRPVLYILDDIQTADNSKTHEMRMQIVQTVDEARRQVKFGGSMLLIDTRKFIDDYASRVQIEPLRSLFHTLHRRAHWNVDEPDAPPYVIDGVRYYFPVDGRGRAALDKAALDEFWRQFGDRSYCTEMLNDPNAEVGAEFSRADFHVIDVRDPEQWERIPIEIRYGLGRQLTPGEEDELAAANLRVDAFNFWDPRGGEGLSSRGDDDFGVGLRLNRYGTAIFVTCMAAGQFAELELWDNVEKLNAHNRPEWNDYELGVDERSCKAAHQKWLLDRSQSLGFAPTIPMHWSKMPKGGKTDRMKRMQVFTTHTARNDHSRHYAAGFFILSDAGLGDLDIINKYIGQWISIGRNTDHNDGPDATSRGIRYFMNRSYQAPPKEEGSEPQRTLSDGVPWSVLKGLTSKPTVKSWGETAS